MAGGFVSYLGTEMQNFAMSLFVLTQTKSALMFSILVACNFLPHILFGGFAGVIADKFDKKKIIVTSDVLSGLTTLLFFTVVHFNGFSYGFSLIIVFTLTTINTFFSPAVDSSLPLIVDKEDLLRANSLFQLIISVSRILGPIVAGIIIVIFNLQVILFFNGISFILSALSESWINIPHTVNKGAVYKLSETKKDLMEGFQYIKETKILRDIISIGGFLNAFLTPLFAISIPYILKITLGYSDEYFAISETVLMAGVILGMTAMGIINKKIKLDIIYRTSIFAIFLSVLGLSSTLILKTSDGLITFLILMVFNFLLGFFIVIFGVSTITTLQQNADQDKIGRVMGSYAMIKYSFLLTGQFIIGFLIERFNPGYVIGVIALIILLTGITSLRILRDTEKKVVLEL